ncbi:phytanoyl-CoA dioxygenase family protein [Qipengyuania sp. ASV99]|uniref:phytanoyl-CoA dioxygenase family protein n=1 Tax=Qipengyuania sp. ASV99 TaxID=3399681 RepID=UPI003A4C6381
MMSNTSTQSLAETALGKLSEDGFVILPSVFSAEYIQALADDIDPYFEFTGRNDFEGRSTQRVYSLVSRTRSADPILENEIILDIVRSVLGRTPLLMRSQGIRVLPGEVRQDLHRDDVCIPIDHKNQTLSVSVMVALSSFRNENGATWVAPRSHRDRSDQAVSNWPTAVQVEMEPGSVLVMLSELLHGAGANSTSEPRTGVFANYCVPWLRTLDNHYLPFSKSGVDRLSPTMLGLLGYDVAIEGGIVYGVVEGRHPSKFLNLIN